VKKISLISIFISVACTSIALLVPTRSFAQEPTSEAKCIPGEISASREAFPEVEGRSETQSVWGLLFPYHVPLWVDEDLKIVWRMTGEGNLKVYAIHEDGTILEPIWGPEAHGGSNWNRPGEEWGTGFHFTKTGCWRIILERGRDVGEVDLLIVEPRGILI
jgi:hypothetical protein